MIVKKIFIVSLSILFFLFNFVVAHAGGPPTSNALVFCNLENLNLGLDRRANDSIKAMSEELGYPFIVYSYYVEDRESFFGDYYPEHEIPNGYSWVHSEFQTQDDLSKNYKVLEYLEKYCPQDVDVLKTSLDDRILSWVGKHNTQDKTQGSTFIIAPDSQANQTFIKTYDFYKHGYDDLEFEVDDGWIFAFSTYRNFALEDYYPMLLKILFSWLD